MKNGLCVRFTAATSMPEAWRLADITAPISSGRAIRRFGMKWDFELRSAPVPKCADRGQPLSRPMERSADGHLQLWLFHSALCDHQNCIILLRGASRPKVD